MKSSDQIMNSLTDDQNQEILSAKVSSILTIAIVGRPNVGKSTLFNRILGYRSAIVTDQPGTTRDRIISQVTWGGTSFLIIDTGGLEANPASRLKEAVQTQTASAIKDADIVIFLADVAEGVTPAEKDISQLLRKTNKNVILAINKVDNQSREFDVHEFNILGLGNPIPISAYHNIGIQDIIASVINAIPKSHKETHFKSQGTCLTIAGRPNVGKSMLTNSILGQKRAIVNDIPGTTRDTLDTPFAYGDELLTLIDTAGIRRRGKIERGIENYSVIRSLKAITRSEIVILVLDATDLVTAQDTHVSSYVVDSFKTMVIAINKWDLASKLAINKTLLLETVQQRFKFARHAPIRFVSALTGEGVETLIETAIEVHEQGKTWLPENEFRLAAKTIISKHTAHPSKGNTKLNFGKVYQESTSPPTFVFQVNRPELVHFSYQRYLENSIRKAFGLETIPLKIIFRNKSKQAIQK